MRGDEDYSIIDRLSRWRNPAMDEEASDMIVLANDICHRSRIDGALVEMEAESDIEELRRTR